jgi:hypothetical protein
LGLDARARGFRRRRLSVADDRFDHLELGGGDLGFLSDALKADLRETRFESIEIQELPEKIFAIRLDGHRLFVSTQDESEIPPYYETLFEYLGKHGVTPRLREFFGELGREVALVDNLVSSAPPAQPAPALEPEPEKAIPGTVDDFPPVWAMKLARAVVYVAGALLTAWWATHKFR